MENAVVNNVGIIARTLFSATYVVLFTILLRDQKYFSLAIFTGTFVVGILMQKKEIFWKLCLAFFGLLSVLYSFRIFGGLEPNSPGVYSRADWFGLESLLFLLLLSSTAISAVAGSRAKPAQ
jgi:hypothetical protein